MLFWIFQVWCAQSPRCFYCYALLPRLQLGRSTRFWAASEKRSRESSEKTAPLVRTLRTWYRFCFTFRSKTLLSHFFENLDLFQRLTGNGLLNSSLDSSDSPFNFEQRLKELRKEIGESLRNSTLTPEQEKEIEALLEVGLIENTNFRLFCHLCHFPMYIMELFFVSETLWKSARPHPGDRGHSGRSQWEGQCLWGLLSRRHDTREVCFKDLTWAVFDMNKLCWDLKWTIWKRWGRKKRSDRHSETVYTRKTFGCPICIITSMTVYVSLAN